MIELPPGTAAIVEHGLEEAPQALLSAPGVPIAATAELVAAVSGAAARAVLEARIAMIVAGHDAEADDMLPIGWLPMEARQCLERVRSAFVQPNPDMARIRALVVQAAAFALAAIDRLDRVKR